MSDFFPRVETHLILVLIQLSLKYLNLEKWVRDIDEANLWIVKYVYYLQKIGHEVNLRSRVFNPCDY